MRIVANRSISISLEEGLLAQLDAQGSNRSALVSEALAEWLARRRIAALNAAYVHLASLEGGDLAYPLLLSAANGLRLPSYAMSWLPTTVHADQLQGPLGRLTPADLAAIATAMIQALDLRCLEPWQAVEDIS
jgi:hypothetical protein